MAGELALGSSYNLIQNQLAIGGRLKSTVLNAGNFSPMASTENTCKIVSLCEQSKFLKLQSEVAEMTEKQNQRDQVKIINDLFGDGVGSNLNKTA